MSKIATPMCTCRRSGYKHASLKETQVDDEGICIFCNHYAVWASKYQLYAKSFSIGGYREVSTTRTAKWTDADILNYFSDVPFKIHPGKLNLNYEGIGGGSAKARAKKRKKERENE